MKLRSQTIAVDAPRELCFEVVAAAGRRLEKRSEREWVVEFTSAVAGREVRTVELLTLDRPRAIHYRWLEGPLPEVRETIEFVGIGDDKTEVGYQGIFSIGKGPLRWVFGRLVVKPLYDRVVKKHLQQARDAAERRVARSRTHPR